MKRLGKDASQRALNRFSILRSELDTSLADMYDIRVQDAADEIHECSTRSDESEPAEMASTEESPGDAPFVYIRSLRPNPRTSQELDIVVETLDTHEKSTPPTLLDCGANALYADRSLAKREGWALRELPRAIAVYNVDGTLNMGGSITHMVDLILRYGNHVERAPFAVCNLGREGLILGHSWLKEHNPEVDWRAGIVKSEGLPRGTAAQPRPLPTKTLTLERG